MKIAYIIEGTYNSGGMERVLSVKANFLANLDYEVSIITTDQKSRPNFFEFSDKIKFYDIGINYYDLVGSSFLLGAIRLFRKNIQCKAKLTDLLMKQKFDIVISMFGNEAAILHNIKDGSKKILEFHLSRYYRLQKGKTGLRKCMEDIRLGIDKRIASKYDRFVVLTSVDMNDWGDMTNIHVIPNPTSFLPEVVSTLDNKKVIAVGRFTREKDYDKMVCVWDIVVKQHPDWILNIFGEGELKEDIESMIRQKNLNKSVIINNPTSQIMNEFLDSSIFLMTSRYEGFGLVIIEAMACGVPPVSFACKCGPIELIENEVDGLCSEVGNVDALAESVCRLIDDRELRMAMGKKSREKVEAKFVDDVVMQQWLSVFKDVSKS